jgi:hypothetical protein
VDSPSTDKHKKIGIGWSLILLHRYEEHGEAFLSRIVTGDETWVFHYTPERNAELMTWKHPHLPVERSLRQCSLQGK